MEDEEHGVENGGNWGLVRMYKVLMITNPSVVVPNRLSKQVLTAVLNVLKLLD